MHLSTFFLCRSPLWSEVHVTVWYANLYVYDYMLQSQGSQRQHAFFERMKSLRRQKRMINIDAILNTLISTIGGTLDSFVAIFEGLNEEICNIWANSITPVTNDVIPCPCTRDQMSVHLGGDFESDPACNAGVPSFCDIFHPGAHECFRSIQPR